MPLYQVYHAVPLTATQQQEIASAITEIHSSTFTSLTALINVDFINVTGKPTFIGGHARTVPSTIHATVRTGPSRTPEMFSQLCTDITDMWDRIVREGDSSFGPGQLRVFITGGFITGVEGGYQLPQAGQDQNWLRDHYDTIRENAAKGHDESIAMLESIRVMQSQTGEVVVG